MKLRTIAYILVCIFLFNSCRDVIFNNPLDPDASRELLKIIKTLSTNLGGEGDIRCVEPYNRDDRREPKELAGDAAQRRGELVAVRAKNRRQRAKAR